MPSQNANLAYIPFLKRVPLLAKLQQADLEMLARDFRLYTYPKGNILFHQGETGRALFIIVSGKVRIYRVTPDGRETTTNIFSTGDLVGEFAVLDGQPRSASGMSLARCELLQMSDVDFLQHLRNMPDLALAVVRLLTQKVRWAAALVEVMGQYDATTRLLHLLVLYTVQYGEERVMGKEYLLDWGMSQSDLATLVGTSREWINQILMQWSHQGLISFGRGKLIILDLPHVIAERDARIQSHINRVPG